MLLVRSRGGNGVGVDIFMPESESKLESLEIHRHRSPADRGGTLGRTKSGATSLVGLTGVSCHASESSEL